MRISDWSSDVCSSDLRASCSNKPSPVSDDDAGGKHQRPSDHDLEDGPQERRLHIAVLDECDRPEFDEDDDGGKRGRRPEMRDKVGQCVAEPAPGGHDARGQPTPSRPAAPGKLSVLKGNSTK